MGEFDFIQRYLAPLAGPEGLGLLDDAAMLTPPSGRDLVITQDTMVEGVHFPSGEWGAGTAEKLLRVNLSDLAAKGATPWGYFLSLSLPRAMDERWLSGFAKGLDAGQQAFSWHVMGGDTTRTDGPLVISLTAIGTVPSGKMVRRSGARIGDTLYVTGTIGDAALGLDLALGRQVAPLSGQGLMIWEAAYQRPEPRLLIRKWLRDNASASIDVSDGLLADAQHIAKASKVGLSINIDSVPLSAPSRDWVKAQVDPQAAMIRLITAGDDYEVLFTSAVTVNAFNGIDVTAIGAVMQDGLSLYDEHGIDIKPDKTGYLHF